MNLSRSSLQGGEPLSPEVYSARAPQDVHEQLQARLVVDTPAQNLYFKGFDDLCTKAHDVEAHLSKRRRPTKYLKFVPLPY